MKEWRPSRADSSLNESEDVLDGDGLFSRAATGSFISYGRVVPPGLDRDLLRKLSAIPLLAPANVLAVVSCLASTRMNSDTRL